MATTGGQHDRQLTPKSYQTVQLQLCHPNALQTFILSVHIDIDYCHSYYFYIVQVRFDNLILNEDDDDDDDVVDPVKIFLSSSLITMQNLVAVSHAVCTSVEGPNVMETVPM